VQGRGVGSGLMQVALNRAELAGHRAVILVGDPEYYARFGFSQGATSGLLMPGPVDRRRFLAVEFAAGGLRGAAGMIVATGARVLRPAALAA
jgi:predicted N-acetyltransferase YhbS